MGLWPQILEEETEEIETYFNFGKEIGNGCLGVVRLCVERKTGETFACKTIQKCILKTSNDVEDVRREVKIMRYLSEGQSHPNVVHLKGVFEDSSSIHIIMECCYGGELFGLIAEKGRIPEPEASGIFREIVEAVDFCHKKGIVHRDLKPENILLTEPWDITEDLEPPLNGTGVPFDGIDVRFNGEDDFDGVLRRECSMESCSSSCFQFGGETSRKVRSFRSDSGSWENASESDTWQSERIEWGGENGNRNVTNSLGNPSQNPENSLSDFIDSFEREKDGVQRGKSGRNVKVGDFGLSVFVDPSCKHFCPFSKSQKSTLQCPTPLYSAPELVIGREYGKESDMWSLGVILYAILGGELPFLGSTQKELGRRIKRGKLKLSKERWLSISDSAKNLIKRLLDTNPSKRPSAEEVLSHPWLLGGGEGGGGEGEGNGKGRSHLERSKSLGINKRPPLRGRMRFDRLLVLPFGTSSAPDSPAGTSLSFSESPSPSSFSASTAETKSFSSISSSLSAAADLMTAGISTSPRPFPSFVEAPGEKTRRFRSSNLLSLRVEGGGREGEREGDGEGEKGGNTTCPTLMMIRTTRSSMEKESQSQSQTESQSQNLRRINGFPFPPTSIQFYENGSPISMSPISTPSPQSPLSPLSIHINSCTPVLFLDPLACSSMKERGKKNSSSFDGCGKMRGEVGGEGVREEEEDGGKGGIEGRERKGVEREGQQSCSERREEKEKGEGEEGKEGNCDRLGGAETWCGNGSSPVREEGEEEKKNVEFQGESTSGNWGSTGTVSTLFGTFLRKMEGKRERERIPVCSKGREVLKRAERGREKKDESYMQKWVHRIRVLKDYCWS